MRCRRIRKKLLDYESGFLPETQREEVRLHLEACTGCASELSKLEFSHATLASLAPPAMTEDASLRVLSSIREKEKAAAPRLAFLRSPRALGIGAAVAAVLIGVALVVGLTVGIRDDGPTDIVLEDRAATELGEAPGAPATSGMGFFEEEAAKAQKAKGLTQTPKPMVKISETDYGPDSLRQMLEGLDVRRQFASEFTMSDAINLCDEYRQVAADEFAGLGGDAPLLEAMISYITAGEPVMLTYYVENASFDGQPAYIIALAAPQRTGESLLLSRTEAWVMSPGRFKVNPDSGVLYFLEHR